MKQGMRVSGVGKGARRTDLDRAQRVMREAKLSEATGGPRGQRAELQDISSQGAMATTASAVSADTGMAMKRSIPTIGAFEPTTRPEESVSTGAGGTSEGAGPEVLMTPVDAPDQAAAFARAMYATYQTPQLRRIVEAFEEEGR